MHIHVWAFYLLQEASSGVQWDPIHLWGQMGTLAKCVVIGLFIMSAYSISVMIERWITYRQARAQSRVFTPAVAECLKEGKIDEAIALGEQNHKSHLAKVLVSGLHELQASPKWDHFATRPHSD